MARFRKSVAAVNIQMKVALALHAPSGGERDVNVPATIIEARNMSSPSENYAFTSIEIETQDGINSNGTET